MIDKLHFCKILKTLFLIAKRENSGSRIVYNIDFKEKKRFVFISFDVNDEYFSNNIQHELIKAMLYRMDCSYRLVDNDGKKCIVIELLNELYQKELLLEYN